MTLHLIDRIAVEDEGEGDAVVCVHGLGGSIEHLHAADAGAGAPSRRSASTCPAAAARSAVEGPLTIERFVETLLSVCTRLERRRARTGSATRWAPSSASTSRCAQPKLVRSLALFGPLIAPPDAARDGDPRARRQGARRRRGRHARDRARRCVQAAISADTRQRSPLAVAFVRESLMRQDPRGLRAHLRGARRRASRRRSSGSRRRCCSSPATRTASRRRSGARDGRQLHAAKSARVVVLPRCGHWTPIERPEECARELRDFLASQR